MKKYAVNCMFALVVLACFFGITTRPAPKSGKALRIDAEKIRAHVKYLASDELEGRGTGQKGGDAAAEYIAAQFKSYGLKPGSDVGTYFQSVPMVSMKTLADTAFTLVSANGQPLATPG